MWVKLHKQLPTVLRFINSSNTSHLISITLSHKTKIKVLQGIRQGKIGGGESVLLSLVENINKDIFSPVVLSFTDGPMVNQLRRMGAIVYVIQTQNPFDISVWNKVRKILIDEQIDIVHAHGTRACSNLFYVAKKLSIPIIYTCHGWSFHQDQNNLKRKLRIQGEKFLTSRTTVNICVSYANYNDGTKLFGGSFHPIVIQNSVDSNRFDPIKNYKDIRSEFNISSSDVLFTFIARFTWQKQPLVLIKAFAEAVKTLRGAKLLMVGDGEQMPEVLELIKSLGMKDQIVLESFRQDVPDILAAADVFILPSLWEGLSVALLEAMSMGKAIIATNVDGTGEVIENGTSGILIPTNNLELNLTEAIIKVGQNGKLRARLGTEARKKIQEHYSADVMTKKNEEVYLDIYNQKSADASPSKMT